MKFLTRLAQIALQAATGINMAAPFIKAVTPDNVDRMIDQAADTSTEVSQIIAQTEVMGQALGLSGTDKLKAAAPLVANIYLKSAALAGHKVKNPELFKAGCEKSASGWADIMNSLDETDLKDKP